MIDLLILVIEAKSFFQLFCHFLIHLNDTYKVLTNALGKYLLEK